MAGMIRPLIGLLALWAASCTSPETRANRICEVCRRPLHANSATLADLDGRQKVFCCPACALSDRLQGDSRIRITAFTDYATGKELRPGAALLVRGSDVNLCAAMRPLIDEMKTPHAVHYDRCIPSLIAFGNVDTASGFVRAHGGTIVRFYELFTR